MSKACFINVGIDQWYCHGSMRLKGSLIDKGFPGDVIVFNNEWPPGHWDRSCVYNCKAAAFDYAIKAGYTTIIWGDSSITALKNTQPFVDVVNAGGYWLGQSGYNCAQVCTDAQLQYFCVSRDWAEQIPDTATGLFGVNIENDTARKFIETWIQAGKDRVFRGSRHHGGQSKDHRFLFGRQDQSCASLIAGKMGMPLHTFKTYVKFKWDTYEAMFHCEGM